MKTAKEVAMVLGLSHRRVNQAAQTLRVKKHGRDYLFTDSDVERIRERIGQQGKKLS